MKIELHTGKKLDHPDDIKDIRDKLKDAQHLSLQGNSLSVVVCEILGADLHQLSHLDIHDCFTGRLKADVPISMDHLFRNCLNLQYLDVGHNALSALGAKHLAIFLQDSHLNTLLLNNTGIGIEGVKHLSKGLEKYCQNHPNGPPLIRFECGRNRLETGSQYLVTELEKCINLKVLRLHQNGIRPESIKILSHTLRGSSAETGCKKLEILDLQDNSFMWEGSEAFADQLLPNLKQLKELNIGECLTKDKGGCYILQQIVKLKELQVVDMTYNELNMKSLGFINGNVEYFKEREIKLNGNVFDGEGELALKLMDLIKTDEWDDLEEPDSDEDGE
eukprot:NODE_121_length_17861_cov_0.498480.p2 type:complete len:333 gc:universal NODE_121_length_17861_cov_0.498480:14746-15744(+)